MPESPESTPEPSASVVSTLGTLIAVLLTTALAATSCAVHGKPEAPPGPKVTSGSEDYGPPGLAKPSVDPSRIPARELPFIDGVALGLFSADQSYDYRMLIDEIADTGARWISLCINFYQDKVDSTEVGIPAPHTASWGRIATTIRQSHDVGLKVLIFPILLIQNPGEKDWRGTIRPTDPDAWYAGYSKLIRKVAEVSEREGAEMLSIGSEFNSMQTDTARWKGMIADLRERYSGYLTYSVNWDSLDAPQFFHDLDFVGMTTYFSLTKKDDPTVAELTEKLVEIRDDVLTWQFQHRIPLIFTEVGFPSQDGANKDPWNYYISTTPDMGEQRDCYEAFTNVWRDVPGLHGLFFYNWFGVGGAEDTGYTPRRKPAEKVMREWFARPRPAMPSNGPRDNVAQDHQGTAGGKADGMTGESERRNR